MGIHVSAPDFDGHRDVLTTTIAGVSPSLVSTCWTSIALAVLLAAASALTKYGRSAPSCDANDPLCCIGERYGSDGLLAAFAAIFSKSLQLFQTWRKELVFRKNVHRVSTTPLLVNLQRSQRRRDACILRGTSSCPLRCICLVSG